MTTTKPQSVTLASHSRSVVPRRAALLPLIVGVLCFLAFPAQADPTTQSLAGHASAHTDTDAVDAEKLVIAHYMVGSTFFQGHDVGDITDPAMYAADGPSREVGGLIQHYPMAHLYYSDATLEEAVSYEMRAAQTLGVDGFQFFLPCVHHDGFMANYMRIIDAFFRVASEEDNSFKLTLCLCNPTDGTQAEKIERWVRHIRPLLEAHRGASSWLRAPDGRIYFYMWCPDALADTMDHSWQVIRDPRHVGEAAEAYRTLANAPWRRHRIHLPPSLAKEHRTR